MTIVKIRLLVAEPYGFQSTDGRNLLYCYTDIDQCSNIGPNGTYLLARSTPFTYRYYTVDSLCFRSRYYGLELEEFIRFGTPVPVTAGWLNKGMKWSHELASSLQNDIRELQGSFLIGSIDIVPNDADGPEQRLLT